MFSCIGVQDCKENNLSFSDNNITLKLKINYTYPD